MLIMLAVRILEKIMQAGYRVIWFYVTEDDEN